MLAQAGVAFSAVGQWAVPGGGGFESGFGRLVGCKCAVLPCTSSRVGQHPHIRPLTPPPAGLWGQGAASAVRFPPQPAGQSRAGG